MTSHRIAIYPGDGIGPQVVDEALRVLDRAQSISESFRLEATRFDWGGDYHARHAVVAPENYLDVLRSFDAIFLVGKNIANPGAAILSAAMMLEWLGLTPAAEMIRGAVERAVRLGHATPDLGGTCTTTQMTDRIIEQLAENSP